MGHMRVGLPRGGNIFGPRHIKTVTNENTDYPKSRLGDGQPDKDFRYLSAASSVLARTDGNVITDAAGTVDEGKFDTWSGGMAVGWTKGISGTGTITQENTIVRSGSAIRLEPGGSGTSEATRIVKVKAGWSYHLQSWMRGGSSSGVSRAEVQLLETKHYLTSGGLWQAAAVDWTSENNTGAYIQKDKTFTIPGFAAVGWKDEVSLRLRYYNTVPNGLAYVEDVALWPSALDLLSMHGHNWDAGIDMQLYSAGDAAFSSPTSHAALIPITVPAAYILLATPQDFRYWQVTFVGTNQAPGEIGELNLLQSQRPLQDYESPVHWRQSRDNQFSRTPSGKRHSVKRSKFKRRFPTFFYTPESQAQLDDLIAIWDRADGGNIPVVIVPNTDWPIVIQATLPDEIGYSQEDNGLFRGFEINADEMPFASAF